jgi:hypothetical protein
MLRKKVLVELVQGELLLLIYYWAYYACNVNRQGDYRGGDHICLAATWLWHAWSFVVTPFRCSLQK